MLFNSLDFALFLPITFLLYWWVGGRSAVRRNAIVLAASYLFYGWWDWRFLGLLAFSTAVDFAVGRAMEATTAQSKRKVLLAISIVVNLGLLGFFKYFNFFAAEFAQAFSFMGVPMTSARLDIVLPVGISFYTFQTLSYSIDVYRGHLKPSRDPIAFAAYVAFFPQLVAGPIERATNLLPQFATARVFDRAMATDGLRQMLWGLFKKVVIADNCAFEVDRIFGHYGEYGSATLVLGAVLFAFQIYCDFSGYSDIAIGCARLFGFSLMRNFAFPYFSRDIAEFWRRWHISLSTWFRDYLYIPLGGSKGGKWMALRNTFIIFLVSGFWHGANWTFLAWGALNAIYFLPLLLTGRNRLHIDTVARGKMIPSLTDALRIATTFGLTCIAWVFFRAESVQQGIQYLARAATAGIGSWPKWSHPDLQPMLILLLVIEWTSRNDQHGLERFATSWPRFARWLFYVMLGACMGLFHRPDGNTFIYFQF